MKNININGKVIFKEKGRVIYMFINSYIFLVKKEDVILAQERIKNATFKEIAVIVIAQISVLALLGENYV